MKERKEKKDVIWWCEIKVHEVRCRVEHTARGEERVSE